MTQVRPKVGQLYSCMEQSKMHGGNPRLTLPSSDGAATLIRFRLDKNPDGPHIIDHGPPPSVGGRLPERVEMLRRQSEALPVYRHALGAAWKYLGRYRVQDATYGGLKAAERTKFCGRPVRHIIQLAEANLTGEGKVHARISIDGAAAVALVLALLEGTVEIRLVGRTAELAQVHGTLAAVPSIVAGSVAFVLLAWLTAERLEKRDLAESVSG